MQHQAVSLAHTCSPSLSLCLALSCNTSIKTQFAFACAAHAAGGKWQRQLAEAAPTHAPLSLPHSPTCLPPHFLSSFFLSLSFSGPSSRRQRHPLSLLPNYRAFNFNFDVACGKHVSWAYVCVRAGVCVCGTHKSRA